MAGGVGGGGVTEREILFICVQILMVSCVMVWCVFWCMVCMCVYVCVYVYVCVFVCVYV